MKALVKPNMHTRLSRGDLSNICKDQSCIYLELKMTKKSSPIQMMILQEGAKFALLHLMEKGINQLNIQWAK